MDIMHILKILKFFLHVSMYVRQFFRKITAKWERIFELEDDKDITNYNFFPSRSTSVLSPSWAIQFILCFSFFFFLSVVCLCLSIPVMASASYEKLYKLFSPRIESLHFVISFSACSSSVGYPRTVRPWHPVCEQFNVVGFTERYYVHTICYIYFYKSFKATNE